MMSINTMHAQPDLRDFQILDYWIRLGGHRLYRGEHLNDKQLSLHQTVAFSCPTHLHRNHRLQPLGRVTE